jgi:phage major head subunit gpT-like protein
MVNVVASAARAVMPGVNDWFGVGYNRYPSEWSEIFDNYTSDKNFEEDVNYYGLGQFRVKPETAPIKYDDMGQAWSYYYRHIVYSLGYAISREAIEDNFYEQLSYARAQALGISANQTMENLGAFILNQGFSSSYLWPDGVALFSASNKLSKGGTFSNTAAGAQLSEASLENAINQIGQYTDDASNKISVMAKKLIVPIQLQFEAERLLGNTQWRPATMDRDIPALAYKGMLPEGYTVNHYLTDTNAYFIKTDCPNGAKRFIRRDVNMANDTSDFDTDVMRFKCDFRVSFGVTDKRALWGNPGA